VMTPQGQMIQYDLSRGKYDVTVETGPSFSSRRQEAAQGMTEFARVVPMAAPLIGDMLAEAQDWPQADKLKERLQALLPPELRPPPMGPDGKPLPPEPPPPPPPDPAMVAMEQKTALAEKQLEIDKAAAAAKAQLDRQVAEWQRDIDFWKAEQQAELDRQKAVAAKQLERDVKLGEAAIEAAPDVLKGFEGMGDVATNLANIAQTMMAALTAPTEVIRDPQTGEIIGSRKQMLPPGAMN